MTRAQVKRGEPANSDLKKRVRSLVDRIGDKEAARQLGIGRATVARLLGSLPLTPGTMALVDKNLPKDDAA